MTELFDPVEASSAIAADYRRYLNSLLPLRDSPLRASLAESIESEPNLVRGPILESTPAYVHGATLRDLILEGVLPGDFARFGSDALPLDRPLYAHQEEATRKARAGRSVVVSTGTGSGKTESFLIPILASLADEREGGQLTPGVRALLLYPMNALANDQMKRLRLVLGATPDVTFGRYIGDTPNTASEAARTFEDMNPGQPRLPNELLSREEMQSTPPHLLLTNYAMLEYLLLRPADMELFEGMHSGTWRFIVVDEAHVYDGARGSELAMLLRRLKHRVSAKGLQCIATSATVGAEAGPAAVTDFASALFDTAVEWVSGDPLRQDLVVAARTRIPDATWGPLTPAEYRTLAASSDLRAAIGALLPAGLKAASPYEALAAEQAMCRIRRQLAQGAESLASLARSLGEGWDAASLRHLIDAGGRVADESGVPLLSARYHLWLRSSEGSFTCLHPARPHVFLARQEQCAHCSAPVFEFGCCTRCGTTYIVGSEVPDGKASRLEPRAAQPNRPTWIALAREIHDDEDEAIWDESQPEVRDAIEICAACGALAPQGASVCASCGSSTLRSGRVIRGHAKEMTGCVVCGGRSRGQVRLFDTGADAAAAVLATSLYQHLPTDTGPAADNPGGGRKLLAFSDSRQGAAFFAPYLGSTYQRLLQRRLLLQGTIASCERELGPSTLDDIIANTSLIATGSNYFARRESRQSKERSVGLWLAQELVAYDTRQSLEGLGLIEFTLDETERIRSLPVWAQLGLAPGQGQDLVLELVKTIRHQGAVSFPEGVDPADEAFAPRLGPIHVREHESDRRLLSWLPTRGTNKRLDYVTRVLAAVGAPDDPADVLSGIWRFLTSVPDPYLARFSHPRHGLVYQLDHAWLVASPGSAGASAFRCDTCGLVTTRSVAGVCPALRCPGPMSDIEAAGTLGDDDHYRHLYHRMSPHPLRVEEHTAQWAPTQAADIQNRFIRGEINALSCSTTFELGVDVGDLQAVLLRNVPPGTANYVQRAGRAGRRTSSAALVVTFAQRRSHDLSRFQEPLKMINGEVTPPNIPLGNERIDRRHAHSVALSAFFRHEWLRSGITWRKVGDFFTPEPGADDPVELLADYLSSNPREVLDGLRAILPAEVQAQLDLDSGQWIEVLMSHVSAVRSEVRQEVEYFEAARQRAFEARKDGLVKQFGRVLTTVKRRDLLGFLGSRNILPKYGFPVDVVELRTQSSANPVGANLDLSRDLSSAIFEYAPGAEVVAGGWLWKSAGVYRMPDRDLVHGWWALCPHCHHFDTSLEQLEEACPNCAAQRRPQRYQIPEFGFIAESNPKRPSGTPPQRSWSGGTHFIGAGEVISSSDGMTAHAPSSIALEARRRARLMAVSTSPSGNGYLICDWCGRGLPTTGKSTRKHEHAWKSDDCSGPMTRTSLAHAYETDVLTLEFRIGQAPSPQQAWSAMYGLLDASATILGTARDDIDGTLWFAHGTPRLVLFDTVPGGAGIVLRIPERLLQILARAQSKLAGCECGEDTSCYSCLRSYRNSSRHDILSRGSALTLLSALTGE